MKAIVYRGVGDVRLEEVPEPAIESPSDAVVRGVLDRVAAHFLTNDGTARKSGQIPPYRASDYSSPDAARRHRATVFQIAPQIERVV